MLPELRLIHLIEVLDARLMLVWRGRGDVTGSLCRLESFRFCLLRLCRVWRIGLGLENLIFHRAFGFTSRHDATFDAFFLVVCVPRV